MNTRTRERGLSYIELSIALCIVAIGAACALVSHRNALIKGQVINARNDLMQLQAIVADYYTRTDTLPDASDLAQQGLEKSADMLTYQIDQTGAVVATFSAKANSALIGEKIRLTPTLDARNEIAWTCATTLKNYNNEGGACEQQQF